MGLGGFFKRIAGGDTNKVTTVFCFVFGADKRFFRRKMESQGSHVEDNINRMAYLSSPDGNGVLSRQANGVNCPLGPVSVVSEAITELYSFPLLNWLPDRQKRDSGSDGHRDIYEEDEILDNSWAEGFALAAQKQDKQEWMSKLSTILLLAVLGAVAMFLLVATSTGLLSDLFSAIPKFFGG